MSCYFCLYIFFSFSDYVYES